LPQEAPSPRPSPPQRGERESTLAVRGIPYLLPLPPLRGRGSGRGGLLRGVGGTVQMRQRLRGIEVTLTLLDLALAGCARKPQPGAISLVWPDPPEEPRVRYVSSISQPSDLGFRHSGLSRFGNWLIGAEKGNEKFVKPFGLALDEADNLCLTDTGANVVSFFDTTHKR